MEINNDVPVLSIENCKNEKLKLVSTMYDFMCQKKYMLNRKEYNLMTGDPIKFKPYKFSLKEIKKCLKRKDLYQYMGTSGSLIDKAIIKKYLKSIGYNNKLADNNIVFTYSTTHGYNLIFDALGQCGDAIIIPCPNYGFFDFTPERHGFTVLTINLKQKENWIFNIEEIEQLINKYNSSMQSQGKQGRVKFFYNCNPHNPTGKVLGVQEIDVMKNLAQLAKKYNFFIIDDLIYRDICFCNYNPIPMANFESNNTISLLGLSKCFGLAALRSGILVANNDVIKKMRDIIFHTLDSVSLLTIASLTGALSVKNKKYYEKYFTKLNKIYKNRFELLIALVKGTYNTRTKKKVYKILGPTKYKDLIYNTLDIQFAVEPQYVQSGFFAVLDFSMIKGKTIGDKKITNDYELFDIFYNDVLIKVLCGQSIMWPNRDQLVARINFAVSEKDLINGIYNIRKLVTKILAK